MDKNEYQALVNTAKKFKVYSHPLRMMILYSIYTNGNCCVHEICKRIKNDCQPIVSQHLSILKKNNIVQSKIIKNKRVYEIVDPFIVFVIEDLKKSNNFDASKFEIKDTNNDNQRF